LGALFPARALSESSGRQKGAALCAAVQLVLQRRSISADRMAKNLYCAVISFSTRTAIFAAINPVSPADLLFKR
jgi:hypothetical protein